MSHSSGKKSKPKLPDKKYRPGQAAVAPNPVQTFLEQRSWIYLILLFVIVCLLYFPVAFGKKAPPATDITQWQGAAHRITEYNKTHKDNALWQPNMFSGMPSYLISLPTTYPFFAQAFKAIYYFLDWRIFMLLIGGFGIFLLLRHLGLDGFTSFFGAVAFVFCFHWTGLLEIGHNTKFKAMMWIPWVFWSILYLRKRPGLLGLGLASSFLILQLRENHPQISYYLYLFLGLYWLYNLIETTGSKDWKKFLLFTLLLVFAFGFTALAVMNPMLSIWEYNPYSIRGADGGLDKAYAQSWSFPPQEIISFFIPDFFGGINNTYWGDMTFTQIYNYSGILVLVLAFFALMGKRKRFAWFLWIACLLSLVMSLGKYGGFISDFLFKHFPYFNKFRVPSMILVIMQFCLPLLAAFGLANIIDKVKLDDKAFLKKMQTVFIIVAVVFLLFLVLGKSAFKGLPFITEAQKASVENELQTYIQQGRATQADIAPTIERIRMERLDLLYKSGWISLLLLVSGLGFAVLFLRRNLSKTLFLILILIITFIDLWIYTGKNFRTLESPADYESRFAKRDYDEFLHSDKENYRIYPLSNRQNDELGVKGKWAYHHQTIQGYSGAKIKRYQDVLEHCLDAQLMQQKINWNLLNMLNVKYLLFPDSLMFPNLQPVFSSNEDAIIVHRNYSALPRAWFVDSLIVETKPDSIFSIINSDRFNPALTAIVEEKVTGVSAPALRDVKPVGFDMHYVAFEVQADKPAFLTVSEIYYPAGWKAFIDGKETKIYPANYILRGVAVPAGKHKLEMKFEPRSYTLSNRLSLAGLLLAALSLAAGAALYFLKRLKEVKPAAV